MSIPATCNLLNIKLFKLIHADASILICITFCKVFKCFAVGNEAADQSSDNVDEFLKIQIATCISISLDESVPCIQSGILIPREAADGMLRGIGGRDMHRVVRICQMLILLGRVVIGLVVRMRW